MSAAQASLFAAVTVARQWAENIADYHTWDFRSGVWNACQAILLAAGQDPVPCKAEDCKGRDHPCPDLEELAKGPML